MQKEGIPALLAGRDLMMRAATGTGKTIAYLAPVIDGLAAQAPRVSRAEGCYALVVTPTRELTLQVCQLHCCKTMCIAPAKLHLPPHPHFEVCVPVCSSVCSHAWRMASTSA